MRVLFLAVSLFAFVFTVHPAEASDDKKKKVIELVQIMGGANMVKQIMEVMVPLMDQEIRKAAPGITEEHRKETLGVFIKEFHDASDIFLNDMIAVYDKVLTEKEIEASIAFYSTPEGKSLLKKMPQLMQAGMVAGQKWGEEVGRRAGEKATQKARSLGYKI